MKPVIIYYSNSGVTEQIANKIKDVFDCDVVKVEPKIPYGSYIQAVKRAGSERKNGVIAEYDAPLINLANIDTIFVGYPIWYSDAPAFLLDYIKKYDLSGKTVIPFSTSGASNIKGSLKALQSAVGNAEIKHPYNCGRLFKDNFERWIEKIRSNPTGEAQSQ